jgi:class 3 adenylate cyclase
MSETRKLAAILAADVVGFSRLTGADEDRTLARLRALRSDLIDPTISVHKGRVVKRTGDGAIVEFRSVVDAVRCAVEIQNAMVERKAGLPDDRRIEFRIGVHLGDVVEESDGDLMGDGVNVAARLEGVAAPGAICLSEDAYRQVKSRLDLAVSDLGATNLKNIAEPVRVYSLQVGLPAEARTPEAKSINQPWASAALPNTPSIAVLPFAEHTDNLEAYDFFLRGRELLFRATKDNNREAGALARRAVELDPRYASAHALPGGTYVLDYANGWSASPVQALEEAEKAARHAVQLDEHHPYAFWALAFVCIWGRRYDEAISAAEKGIVFNPSFAEGYTAYGLILHHVGRSEEALKCHERNDRRGSRAWREALRVTLYNKLRVARPKRFELLTLS